MGFALGINFIGLIALLSTTIDSNGVLDFTGIFLKQVVFTVLGLLIYYFIAKSDISYTKHLPVSAGFYIIVMVLLVLVFLFPDIKGAHRWITILGVQFQPSELAKISIILLTASIMSMKDKGHNEWKLAFLSFFPAVFMAGLIYIEPSGSMALINMGLWFLVVFSMLSDQLRSITAVVVMALGGIGIGMLISGAGQGILLLLGGMLVALVTSLFKPSWRKIVPLGLIIGVIIGVGVVTILPKIFEHQQGRIEAFLDPESTKLTTGFNVNQSIIAIGSGGFFGKGFGYGTQTRLQFIPERQTDFIFATYAEQFGLFGSIILLGLFLAMIMSIFMSALKVNDKFASVVIVALGLKILLEFFINIGTNLAIIPATGIPLPLVSAGGTITLATYFSLGIIQSIIGNSVEVIDNEEIII